MNSSGNLIESFAHCKHCVKELMRLKDVHASPREYARFEVGFTEKGLQIWCVRHNCNVMHIDFEGARHPTDTSGLPTPMKGKRVDTGMGDDQMLAMALCLLLEDKPGFAIPVKRISDDLGIGRWLGQFWDLRHGKVD